MLAWRLSMFLIRRTLEYPASGLREADVDTGVDMAAAVEGVAARRAAAEAAPTGAEGARSEDAAAAELEDAAAAHSEDAAAAVYGLGRCQSVNSRWPLGSQRTRWRSNQRTLQP